MITLREALQLSRIAAVAAWSVIRLGQTQCWYPNSCFCDVVDVRQGRGSEESEEEASISAPPVAATLPVSSPQQNILHPRLLLDYGSVEKEGLTTLSLLLAYQPTHY